MDLKNKKFVASYSGGKDSILAIYRAIQQGMKPVGLIITYNTDAGRSWFHGVPEEVLQDVSQSLHIPITLIKTTLIVSINITLTVVLINKNTNNIRYR